MALYRDVHSRIAVRDRFADDNEYAAELVQVGWMTGESRREVVPKSPEFKSEVRHSPI